MTLAINNLRNEVKKRKIQQRINEINDYNATTLKLPQEEFQAINPTIIDYLSLSNLAMVDNELKNLELRIIRQDMVVMPSSKSILQLKNIRSFDPMGDLIDRINKFNEELCKPQDNIYLIDKSLLNFINALNFELFYADIQDLLDQQSDEKGTMLYRYRLKHPLFSNDNWSICPPGVKLEKPILPKSDSVLGSLAKCRETSAILRQAWMQKKEKKSSIELRDLPGDILAKIAIESTAIEKLKIDRDYQDVANKTFNL